MEGQQSDPLASNVPLDLSLVSSHPREALRYVKPAPCYVMLDPALREARASPGYCSVARRLRRD